PQYLPPFPTRRSSDLPSKSPNTAPFIDRPRRVTVSELPMVTVIVRPTKATTPVGALTVIDLVIVAPPKPPLLTITTSAPAAAWSMAPCRLRHGVAALEQSPASLPVPERNTRAACAKPRGATMTARNNDTATARRIMLPFIPSPYCWATVLVKPVVPPVAPPIRLPP